MDLEHLNRKLLAAARAHPPGDRVPFAFEKRIIALVGSRPFTDSHYELARGLGRAAISCLSIMILLCAWSAFEPAEPPTLSDFSPDLDSTVLAAAENEDFSSGW